MQRAENRVKAAQIALQQSEQQLKKPNDVLEQTGMTALDYVVALC